MNTQKYKVGNLGLLAEADRTMYKGKDTVSKSIIDPERTHLNYNVCPHPQYTAREVKAINKAIRGKELAKNAVAWGSTIITVPQDYEGDLRAFFATAYDGLRKMYGLRDEDIISAYVHMDETTPHMHFYFLPVVHEQEKDRMNWDGVMPRKMYKTQHNILQKYMTERLGEPVNLLNGETKGIAVQGMTAEEKRLSMRIEKLKKWAKDENKKVGELRKESAALENRNAEIKAAGDKLMAGIDGMVKAHDGLRRALNVGWKIPEETRDKITIAKDRADVRIEQALLQPMDDVGAILSAADAAERATRTYSALKQAAQGKADVDDLLADDDFDLC